MKNLLQNGGLKDEVLEFTVLEHLLTDDADMASEYADYFGEETKRAAIEVGKWYK